ncbi:MAG: HIT family protein [Patescibacteria group bacterium]
MTDCIFCKIVKGEIPSFKVFENDKVFCFLDINPLTRGHALVIPKNHVENVFDVSEEDLKEIIIVVKNLSEKMKKVWGIEGVNIMNASGKASEQSVFHLHFHIVPRRTEDGLEMNKWWGSKNYKADFEELKQLAEKIYKGGAH